MNTTKSRVFLLVLVVYLCRESQARADLVVNHWLGPGPTSLLSSPLDLDWNVPSHWSLHEVPTEDHWVVFDKKSAPYAVKRVELKIGGEEIHRQSRADRWANSTLPFSLSASNMRRIYSVGRLTIGPSYEVVVERPLHVASAIVVDAGGRLVVGADLVSGGDMIIAGSVILCGTYDTQVDVAFVDVLSSAELGVAYSALPTRPAQCLAAFHSHALPPPETQCKAIDPTADEVFGVALASERAVVVVPGTKGPAAVSEAEHQRYVSIVASKLSSLAGGATSIRASGYWISPASQSLVQEPVTQVLVHTSLTRAFKEELKNLALWLCRELDQEAVFVALNDQAFLVTLSSSTS